MSELTIRHDTERRQLIASVDGHDCLLEYEVLANGDLDFVHTYTPSALRGRGIAGRIVAAGFELAKSRGVRVVPTCPFVGDYVDRHPEVAELVAQ